MLFCIAIYALLPSQGMSNPILPLQEINSGEGIVVDLQYKKSENITGKALYPKNAKAYLHPKTIQRLKKAASILRAHGYGITLLDAWRPFNASARLWNKAVELDLREYYCPPDDSGHIRGVAVDITLHNLSNPSQTLKMPSGFDQPISYPVDPQSLENAQRLKMAMNQAGFVGHRKEWWHFSLPNDKDYLVVNGENHRGNGLPKMNY